MLTRRYASHASPTDETEKPKTNGHDHGPATNGVGDVEMKNSDAPAKATEESGKDESNAEKATEVKAQELDSKPATVEDVEMTDAAQVEKPAETSESTKCEPTKDTEMADTPTGKSDKPADAPASTANGADEALPTSEVDLQPASLSQLAIESNEAQSVPKPSIEVNMEDAPPGAPSTKIARERDDDGIDEPAPKRAKTEPAEDEPTSTVATTSSAPAEAPTQNDPFARLDKWHDAKFNQQQITPYQRREIRKVLGRVKKTKQGGHFRDSVQKLWPALWESYVAKIEKPTDLSEIDRTLRDPSGAYVTISHFRNDLILMYENTLAFNGPIHDVTNAARGSIRSIWDDVITIPQEEPVKPKPVPKPKAPRESRTATHVEAAIRKPSIGPGSPAVESPKVNTAPQHPAHEVRRGSSATEGDRPKRTVRPPKTKDIDYTTKPSRKKLKPELQFAEEVLGELTAPKNKHLNSWFMEAVDAEGLNIPTYYSVIKKPMDLGKVSRLLAAGEITSLKEFEKAVRQIFINCYTFNGPVDQGNAVSFVAKQLEDYFNSQMKTKDAWLARHAKNNAPPPASHPSDDEEEEEEGEEAAAVHSVDASKEVRELEAKLREESGKLNDLYAADSPNHSLIGVQQGILRMVQEALLTAKQSLSEYRQKHDKSGKKSSKPSKPKPSGGAARKPPSNHTSKKSGGTKKASTKKSLNAGEKDAIANAINDLDGVHLDRAIDIIKRDTGQNVSKHVDTSKVTG